MGRAKAMAGMMTATLPEMATRTRRPPRSASGTRRCCCGQEHRRSRGRSVPEVGRPGTAPGHREWLAAVGLHRHAEMYTDGYRRISGELPVCKIATAAPSREEVDDAGPGAGQAVLAAAVAAEQLTACACYSSKRTAAWPPDQKCTCSASRTATRELFNKLAQLLSPPSTHLHWLRPPPAVLLTPKGARMLGLLPSLQHGGELVTAHQGWYTSMRAYCSWRDEDTALQH